jgi:hypothetical protein
MGMTVPRPLRTRAARAQLYQHATQEFHTFITIEELLQNACGAFARNIRRRGGFRPAAGIHIRRPFRPDNERPIHRDGRFRRPRQRQFGMVCSTRTACCRAGFTRRSRRKTQPSKKAGETRPTFRARNGLVIRGVVASRRAPHAEDVGNVMKQYLPFVPSVFGKVLAIVMTLVLIGFIASYLYYGELTGVDIAGTLISALIFTYMVHLWLLPPDEHM